MEHQSKVEQQFGSQAQAYLGSTVHSQGADLQQLATLASGTPVGAHILDLGCGAGHASFAVAPHAANVVAYDLSNEMLDVVAATAAARGLASIHARQGPAETLPFDDHSFDLVISRYSAHHWSDPVAALHEAARVLKPDGRACFIDVVGPQGQHAALMDTHLQAMELLRDVSHVRDYSPAEWRDMLLQAGFELVDEHAWKLPIDFDRWVARMRTPAALQAALRLLLSGAPSEVQTYYALTAKLGFQLESALFEARLRSR